MGVEYPNVYVFAQKGEMGRKFFRKKINILFKRSSVRFNLFLPNVPFLYPLKTSDNQSISDASRGYRNETFG